MTQPNTTSNIETERAHAAAEARAALQRRAEAQGIKPFDAAEWLADTEPEQPPAEVRREVDEFLVMLRSWRNTASARRVS